VVAGVSRTGENVDIAEVGLSGARCFAASDALRCAAIVSFSD